MKPAGLAATGLAASWVVRILGASARLDLDADSEGRLEAAGEPFILAYWHDQVFLSVRFLRHAFLTQDRPLGVMASHSKDGELVARVASSLGVRVVRGSSSRGGREGLRALHREIVKHRTSLVVLPDGPRGPRHEAKPGVVVLSQLSGRAIVPMAFAASRQWTLRSWDRLSVPRPGCRIRALAGEPIHVPRELSDEAREHHRLALTSTLADLDDLVHAERAVRRPGS